MPVRMTPAKTSAGWAGLVPAIITLAVISEITMLAASSTISRPLMRTAGWYPARTSRWSAARAGSIEKIAAPPAENADATPPTVTACGECRYSAP